MSEFESELMRRLLSPDFWPDGTPPPELIETHVSWIVLAGERAYKIKKPVLLSFVDFRSLEARRRACLDELRLNRRVAPEIYQAVAPIGGTPDAPKLNEQPAIEYAVVMRRFPQSALLDAQLETGGLSDGDMREAARMLARFHGSLDPAPPSSPYGTPEAIIDPFDDTLRDLAAEVEEHSPALPSALAALHRRLTPLFEARKAQGLVRECHGDLHLRNLIKLDGRIMAFDCLEFAPMLRWIDVINEAAFLFMDLEAHDAAPLAWRFLDEYLQATGDYAGLSLLRYYSAYHAFVRAKIAKLDGEERKLGRYCETGEENLAERRGIMVLTHGYSGSGKTTVTEPLVGSLPAVRIRSDIERKRLAGLPPDAATGAAFEQGIYDAAGTRQTYDRLLSLAVPGVLAGCNLIVDAAFLKSWQRRLFAEAARVSGFPLVLVECTAPRSVLRERVAGRKAADAGRGVSEAGPDILERQFRSSDGVREDEGLVRIALDTASDVDPDELARRIRESSAGTQLAAEGGAS